MQKLNPLTQDLLRLQHPGNRKIYYLDIKPDINPLEAAMLSYFLATKASMGGYDWWSYIERHELKRHFEEEKC